VSQLPVAIDRLLAGTEEKEASLLAEEEEGRRRRPCPPRLAAHAAPSSRCAGLVTVARKRPG
jgi:hypothetical protein